jgi:hypothetical protein
MKPRESGRTLVFWKVEVGVEGWEWNRGYGVGEVLLLDIRLDLGFLGDSVYCTLACLVVNGAMQMHAGLGVV